MAKSKSCPKGPRGTACRAKRGRFGMAPEDDPARFGPRVWLEELEESLISGCSKGPERRLLAPVIKDSGAGREMRALLTIKSVACRQGREISGRVDFSRRLRETVKAVREQILNASHKQIEAYNKHADKVFNEE